MRKLILIIGGFMIFGCGEANNNFISPHSNAFTQVSSPIAPKSNWDVSCSKDKFTDQNSCISQSSSNNSELGVTKKEHIIVVITDKGYVAIGCASKNNYGNSIVRVDNNNAFHFSGSSVGQRRTLPLLKQMQDGQSMIVSCRGNEFAVDLTGFSKSYKYMVTRINIDPLKEKMQNPPAKNENDTVVTGIRANCSDEWPENYQMQKYCINKQIDSFKSLSDLYKNFSPDSEQHKIMARCLDEWPLKFGGHNYQMVMYCSKKQLTAYDDLNN